MATVTRAPDTPDAPDALDTPDAPAAEVRSSGRSLGWWGMVCLIATEATLFALLLFANFYLRANAPKWPLGDIKNPELLKTSIRSVILVGSSVPMHLGERCIKRGNRRGMIAWLSLGWIMGAVFLAGHVMEYVDVWKEFTPSTNAYGSVFYTITGLHALHLILGMLMIGWVLVRAMGGRYDGRHHVAVETTVMYWHFVDVVWIAVFTSLYLSVSWP